MASLWGVPDPGSGEARSLIWLTKRRDPGSGKLRSLIWPFTRPDPGSGFQIPDLDFQKRARSRIWPFSKPNTDQTRACALCLKP